MRSRHVTRLITLLSLAVGTASFVSAADDKSPPASQPTTMLADYQIHSGDLLRITVWDLQGPNQETVLIKRVANSGGISIPYATQPLKVKGTTEAETEAAIRDFYAEIQALPKAIVSVLVLQGADGQNVPPGYF